MNKYSHSLSIVFGIWLRVWFSLKWLAEQMFFWWRLVQLGSSLPLGTLHEANRLIASNWVRKNNLAGQRDSSVELATLISALANTSSRPSLLLSPALSLSLSLYLTHTHKPDLFLLIAHSQTTAIFFQDSALTQCLKDSMARFIFLSTFFGGANGGFVSCRWYCWLARTCCAWKKYLLELLSDYPQKCDWDVRCLKLIGHSGSLDPYVNIDAYWWVRV